MKSGVSQGETASPSDVRYSITAVQRALDILELVAFSGDPIHLQAIAERSGIPKATCFRLLANLEDRRYVRRLSDGSYRVGARALLLADLPVDRVVLRDAARREMIAIRDTFGHTVSLALRVANQLLYLDSVEGTQTLRFVEPAGTLGPLHATALGKALLAYCDEATRRHVAESIKYVRFTERTVGSSSALLDELDRVRGRGYAMDDEESVPGALCLAVPILDRSSVPMAALSVSAPSAALELDRREDIVRRLREAAERVAVAMKEVT